MGLSRLPPNRRQHSRLFPWHASPRSLCIHNESQRDSVCDGERCFGLQEREVFLGSFATEGSAAKAHDVAALRLRADHAAAFQVQTAHIQKYAVLQHCALQSSCRALHSQGHCTPGPACSFGARICEDKAHSMRVLDGQPYLTQSASLA